MPDGSSEHDGNAERVQNCAVYNLRRTARAATRHYDECLRPAGIRTTQFTLLNILRAYPGVTVQKLAEATLIERTTLSRNVRTMEREGWIELRPRPTDRRYTELHITKAGLAKFEEALPLWSQAQNFVESKLNDPDLSGLRGALQDASEVFGEA